MSNQMKLTFNKLAFQFYFQLLNFELRKFLNIQKNTYHKSSQNNFDKNCCIKIYFNNFARFSRLNVKMEKFKFYNNIAGWVVFAVSALTYLLTMEPTASFWDCGEFIATAVKLEVGHPPGAPLWMIIGRVAALFAGGNVENQAMMINAAAALASAFTVLFLFWSITHIARKIINKINYDNNYKESLDYSLSEIIVILGSGVVGSLIYCFSDTAWFSAVEAEVYSMSSLFTAVVFWCILKWENCADEKYSNRWLILIAYLMGLSIGVHLLNLLVIPAIVFVYYFKKYPTTRLGNIVTMGVAVVILAAILYVVIPQTVNVAAYFDLFFVNVLHASYGSGLLFFVVVLTAALVWGLYATRKKGKVLANTIILAFAVMMIGYGTFAMTVIRASAGTPINENDPSNGFNLLSYLNRDQYGDRPLLYGNYYNADVISQEQLQTYMPTDSGYVKVNKTNPKYVYDKENCTIFPRMYSSTSSHISAYKSWGNISGDQKPTFGENLLFFFRYQLGHMYFRYFMWNFAGRQNDTQSHGSYINGNWISGIGFIDSIRLGDQSALPDRFKNNKARNCYYLLPLILGLLGIFFTITYDSKSCFVIFLFFLLTGIAIVVYLNQTPYQPRERDYAYAGSFYAFSLWCGLGVMAVYDFVNKYLKNKVVAASVVAGLCTLVPIQMCGQNWDDHNRAGRYTARDFARNYLESCAPNAILFTFGDNDTFPLWYAQHVEGIRTDVRVVNLSLLGTDWYIAQMMQKQFDSDPVPFTLSAEDYSMDKRNVLPVSSRPNYMLDEKYKIAKDEIDKIYKPLYQQFLSLINNSSFEQKYPSDYKAVSSGADNLGALKFVALVNTLSRKEIAKELFGDTTAICQIRNNAQNLAQAISNQYLPISSAIKFIGSNRVEDMLQIQSGPQKRESYNYLPDNHIAIPVNVENCLANGTLDQTNKSKAQQYIKWDISKRYLLKNDVGVLDIIAANDWKRPIYFATSAGSEEYIGLQKFFRLEGFAYRLMPYPTKSEDDYDYGEINSDIMYANLMDKFTWGRMEQPDVTIEYNNMRQINILDIRNTFARLANQLSREGKKDKANEVLQRCLQIMPKFQVPYDQSMLPVIDAFYNCGQNKVAVDLSNQMIDEYDEILKYFTDLKKYSGIDENYAYGTAVAVLQNIGSIASAVGENDVVQKVMSVYRNYVPSVEQDYEE